MSEPTIIITHAEARRIADLLLLLSQAAEWDRDALRKNGYDDEADELDEDMRHAVAQSASLNRRIGGDA